MFYFFFLWSFIIFPNDRLEKAALWNHVSRGGEKVGKCCVSHVCNYKQIKTPDRMEALGIIGLTPSVLFSTARAPAFWTHTGRRTETARAVIGPFPESLFSRCDFAPYLLCTHKHQIGIEMLWKLIPNTIYMVSRQHIRIASWVRHPDGELRMLESLLTC